MTNGRDEYVGRVVERLKRLLDERREALVSEFSIARVDAVQTDGPVSISLDARPGDEGWHDCEELFREIAIAINDEFSRDKWYFGIDVQVPLNYLGARGARARLANIEQDLDNTRFRSVRFREDRDHG